MHAGRGPPTPLLALALAVGLLLSEHACASDSFGIDVSSTVKYLVPEATFIGSNFSLSPEGGFRPGRAVPGRLGTAPPPVAMLLCSRCAQSPLRGCRAGPSSACVQDGPAALGRHMQARRASSYEGLPERCDWFFLLCITAGSLQPLHHDCAMACCCCCRCAAAFDQTVVQDLTRGACYAKQPRPGAGGPLELFLCSCGGGQLQVFTNTQETRGTVAPWDRGKARSNALRIRSAPRARHVAMLLAHRRQCCCVCTCLLSLGRRIPVGR